MSSMTWEALVELEPRLADLLAEAKTMPVAHPDYDDLAAWHGYQGWPGLKPRLVHLVGWFAQTRDPILTSPAAYDVAYHTILGAMPRPVRRW